MIRKKYQASVAPLLCPKIEIKWQIYCLNGQLKDKHFCREIKQYIMIEMQIFSLHWIMKNVRFLNVCEGQSFSETVKS